MLLHGILGLLGYGDMTGYEIRKSFGDSLSHFWEAQTSQIYRELHTLESKGWITVTTIEQSGKPDKRRCHITESGQEELMRWLSEDGKLELRFPIMMRVFFMGNRPDEENIKYFRRFAAQCREYLKNMEQTPEIIAAYRDILDQPSRARYWEMTLDYGRRYLQTYIDWAEHCIQLLEEDK